MKFLVAPVVGMFLLLFSYSSQAAMPLAKDSLAKPLTVIKSGSTKAGDRAFAKLKFTKAIKKYTKSITKDTDTVYLVQKIADAYRITGNTAEAEKWYAKIADNPKAGAAVKYNYAEVLRANKNYDAAKKYYEAYARSNPNSAKITEALAGMDKIPALGKENTGAYRVEVLNINTAKSDYAPAIYKDNKLVFSSNRSNKKAVYDKWNLNRYSKVYVASLDSTLKNEKAKLKTKCKTYESNATYAKTNSELVFSAGSFKKKKTTLQNGERLPRLQLYSVAFEGNKGKNMVALAVNGEQFTSTQPALTADGKTLYFASDKLGGYGGTDIYIAVRDANGKFGNPQNLGPEVNSPFDEKFPFIASDGTLYFSSNNPAGLGGLDVYKTKPENGHWLNPENLGAPVNTNRDDFSFVIDSANKSGYLASNRDGGMGEDDIYKFTYDESKQDYKVTVRVEDAITQKPIPMASLALDCKGQADENTLADRNGEKIFTLKGGKSCTVQAMSNGYKAGSAEVSVKNKNTTVPIALKPDVIKLVVTVREKETNEPLHDVAISLTAEGSPAINYSTNEKGILEAAIPAGKYTLTSPDYPSANAQFSEKNADAATGEVKLEVLIPRAELEINVPLTANCFSTTVTITNLKTGEKNEVSPNTNGELRLDLKINNLYLIEHGGKADTLSTVGLRPGMNVEGSCKFYVGQTWIVHNIYYDLNKWTIRKDATADLDNLVRLMKQYPTLEIELSSHTDCRASAKYNVVLSARRARAAVDYITRKGIKVKRILAAGYGESVIINGCVCEPTNESPCTDPQHQANRRTEVKVLKY